MGWVCVLVFGPLLKTLSAPAFLWLLAGGIIYALTPVRKVLALNVASSLVYVAAALLTFSRGRSRHR